MNHREQLWVKLLDSSRMRRVRGSAAARRLLGSEPVRDLERRRRRWLARRAARREPGVFSGLETVCLFVGHAKSGGTLLGAMLDAHPEAVIADEVDVLDQLEGGVRREELFHVLARNSRREAMKGRVTARRLGGYSLAVPGQWQGRYRSVRVVGESRAGPTTRRLGDDVDQLARLRALAEPAALRFIHVVRNPLDPVGAMVRRGGRSVEDAFQDYAGQVIRLERLRSWLGSDELLTVRYEELTAHPEPTLSTVLGFLRLEAEPAYLRACSSLIDPHRPGERRYVTWTPERLARVRCMVGAHGFLDAYRDEIEPESVTQ